MGGRRRTRTDFCRLLLEELFDDDASDSVQIVVWLPALCRKMGVPYCIVKDRSRLGQLVYKKTCTALAVTSIRDEVCMCVRRVS